MSRWITEPEWRNLELRKEPGQEESVPLRYDVKTGRWYWYDETWGQLFGPHASKVEAEETLKRYCKEVLGD